MKKLFAILLTLALVFTLPPAVMAEETAADTAAEEVTTIADTAAEEVTTAAETAENAADAETGAPAASETESESEHKMNFGFFPETLSETLPVMGMGMLGIFAVTCVIVLAVVVLSKIGKEKEG